MAPAARLSLRAALAAALVAAWASGPAPAQESGAFMLRGIQDALPHDLDELDGPGDPAGEAAASAPAARPLPRPDPDAPIGAELAGPVEDDPGAPLAGPMSVGALPADPRRAPAVREAEDDPFAPPGIALGSFVLRPSIDIGVEHTDNIDETPEKRSATGLLAAPRVDLASDWARHEVAFELRGTATFYRDESLNSVEGSARLSGRYDLADETAFDAAVSHVRGGDAVTDPALAAEGGEATLWEAELGASHRFARAGLDLRGTVRRVRQDALLFEDDPADDGLLAGDLLEEEAVALRRQASREAEVRLRGSFEATPALEPFVEVAAGRLSYDRGVDGAGFRRGSRWGEMVGGLIVDLGPKWRGEAAVGYRAERFDDPRLADLDGLVAAAEILWSPRRLTEVRLQLSAGAERTLLPGVPGAHAFSAELALSRRLRRDLALEAGLYFERHDFVGIDRTDRSWGGHGELAYSLSRYAALVGRYDYERRHSTEPGLSTDINTVSVRLRLQR